MTNRGERIVEGLTIQVTRRLIITPLPPGTQVWLEFDKDNIIDGPYPAVAIANQVDEMSWP